MYPIIPDKDLLQFLQSVNLLYSLKDIQWLFLKESLLCLVMVWL